MSPVLVHGRGTCISPKHMHSLVPLKRLADLQEYVRPYQDTLKLSHSLDFPVKFLAMCYSVAFPNKDNNRLAAMLTFPFVCYPDCYCYWQCPEMHGFSILCTKSNQSSLVTKHWFSQAPGPGRIPTMNYLVMMRTAPGKKATHFTCSYP